MNSRHIHLIRQSFKLMEPRAALIALLFYQRLFEAAPQVRQMFSGDIEAQGAKLMAMLGTIVGSLDSPDDMIPALAEMGKRHADYGVRAEHYEIVGRALLDTFQDALGTSFTSEAREAWAGTYEWIATQMKSGAAAISRTL